MVELDRVRDECLKLVTQRSMLSAGAAAVPVPGLDVGTDVALLTTMLPGISKRFGLDHDSVAKLDPLFAEQLMVIATSLGNNVIGQLVTKELVIALMKRVGVRIATKSVAKYIPIVGSMFAAGVSFGAMKLVGNRHVYDCYETVKRAIGPDLLSADPPGAPGGPGTPDAAA